jgi:hypothetical protein
VASRVQLPNTTVTPLIDSQHHHENFVYPSWHPNNFAEDGWHEFNQNRINFQDKIRRDSRTVGQFEDKATSDFGSTQGSIDGGSKRTQKRRNFLFFFISEILVFLMSENSTFFTLRSERTVKNFNAGQDP